MNFGAVLGASLRSGYALPPRRTENGGLPHQPAEAPLIQTETVSRQSRPHLINPATLDASTGGSFGSGTISSDVLQFNSAGLLDTYQFSSGASQLGVYGNSQTFSSNSSETVNVFGNLDAATGTSSSFNLYPAATTLGLNGTDNSFESQSGGDVVNLGINSSGILNFSNGGTVNTSNNNTYQVNGATVQLNIDCILDDFTVSQDDVNVETDSQASLTGTSNSVTASSADTLTFGGAGGDYVSVCPGTY